MDLEQEPHPMYETTQRQTVCMNQTHITGGSAKRYGRARPEQALEPGQKKLWNLTTETGLSLAQTPSNQGIRTTKPSEPRHLVL